MNTETDAEYVLRICKLKEQIGSWEKVADIINSETGEKYDESTYRRRYKKFCENTSTAITQPTELGEKIKLQTLNLERGRFDRHLYRQQLYFEQIKNAITTLPLPRFYYTRNDSFYEVEKNIEYLLTLADVHYGANFVSENNEYSTEIAKERFEYLTYRTIDFIEKHGVTRLHVVSLGDLIQGILRVSDIQLNETSIVKATVEVSRLIAMYLNEVSAYTKIEYYHVPQANHTQIRPLGTKASELSNEDIEYIIGNYIKDLCSANQNISVHLVEDGKSYIKIPIFDYNILAMHGHQIKNIDSSIKDLTILTREFIDCLILGHLHNGKIVPGYEGVTADAEVFISPSFVGSCPYSDSISKGAKSAVSIYGFDAIYGCTEKYKIILN